MKANLRDFLEFATETAWQAGRLTLGYFQAGVRPEFKADDSPVTVADRAAEQLIRRRIAERFPDHLIVGEEFGDEAPAGARSAYRWFIDPIDGTKSFVRGVPLYAVLLGLEIAGRVEVGVAYFPALNEMLVAASGEGCWWNGRRAQVSAETALPRSLACHADTASFAVHGRGAAWGRLQQATYYNAGWCDAYGYLLVATGRAELALDPIMNVWDCAPFPPIFREAGGYFGDWQGNETIYAGEALATTPALLPQILATFAQGE
ncbi:MAG: inositol monophosphatase family protein [Ardenticatenaceae bacterium]|nr:inositol monophosphatase family protein [Ardenticatenaceae bacterium]